MNVPLLLLLSEEDTGLEDTDVGIKLRRILRDLLTVYINEGGKKRLARDEKSEKT